MKWSRSNIGVNIVLKWLKEVPFGTDPSGKGYSALDQSLFQRTMPIEPIMVISVGKGVRKGVSHEWHFLKLL